MFVKFNALLLTTCVSVMALSIYTTSPAKAGFEWIEPQEAPVAQRTEEIQLPKGSALPIPAPTAPVDEEILKIPPQKMQQTAAPQKTQAKSQKGVMKSMSLDKPRAQPTNATPTVEKTISRQKITPSPVPATQPKRKKPKPTPQQLASQKVPATAPTPQPENILPPPVQTTAATPYADEPVTQSYPRRKKPNTSQKNSSKPTSDSVTTEKSAGLKINPFPKGGTPTPIAPPPQPTTQMSDGDRALQGVYKGEQEAINWNQTTRFTVIEGFGSDIPLALALGQIVPPSFAYSFGDGVNPGQKVSWNGGKPWNEVLSEVLAPLGLEYEISGQKLILNKSLGPSAHAKPVKKKLN